MAAETTSAQIFAADALESGRIIQRLTWHDPVVSGPGSVLLRSFVTGFQPEDNS
jgi:hypothetical protein